MNHFSSCGVSRLVLGLAAAALVIGSACGRRAPHVAGVPEVVDFNFHVKPILSDRCFKCHGPDERVRKASLRLDPKEVAFGELPSGHRAVVPGRPSSSELVARILSTDPKVLMPAADSRSLAVGVEKAVLVRWVEQGADWKPHWSLIPPRRPPVPSVRQTAWPRGAIDRFVLATLESKGLTPAARRPRETLLRRVTIRPHRAATHARRDRRLPCRSLPGCLRARRRPPAGLASLRRADGGRWLDVARYADTHGYQDDGMRTMWPWRDWVISAFNRNLRVDSFITWQLAGDLLPDATQEQQLATGFNRNHMQNPGGRRRPGGVPHRVRRRPGEHDRPRCSWG